jgi:hypothetical protein
VLKYSPAGQLLWSRIQTGTNLWGGIHEFAIDPQGNSSLVVGGRETTLIQFDPAGEIRWSFTDPSPEIDTIAVAMDAAGHTLLGTTLRVNGDNEILLRNFDANGTLLWSRQSAEGRYNRLGALAVDRDGNFIVAGTGELPEIPNSRMFVQKYSLNGQKLWETRTGVSGWEISYIAAMAVGPNDDITVLTMSDDDYPLGEQSGITRIGADGQLRYRLTEPQILVSHSSALAVDSFGNAYVTGSGGRVFTGADAVTAKYDASGNRPWLVYYDGTISGWQYGLGVGVDAVGDVRVLAIASTGWESSAEFSLLHYRQYDPQSKFRLQLIPDPSGTFHLGTPAGEPFQIQASTDLQNWTTLTEAEQQQLLQPGATTFLGSPRRFFRLVSNE